MEAFEKREEELVRIRERYEQVLKPWLGWLATDLEEYDKEDVSSLEVEFDDESINIRVIGNKQAYLWIERVLRRHKLTRDYEVEDKPQAFISGFWRDTELESDQAVVWVTFSSTVCRQRKVGMRTVEMPVFEVVCE